MELSIKKSLEKLWVCLSRRRKSQFGFLLLLMVIGSFAEVISIGAVLPFLGVLVAPEQIFEHNATQTFIQWFGIQEPSELLLPLTIFFILAVIAAAVMRLILLWASTRLTFATGADLSIDIYTRTLYQPYSVHCRRNSSEIIAAISHKTDEVIYKTILPVTIILNCLIIIFSILFALFIVQPLVALVTLFVLGSIYGVILKLKQKQLMKESIIMARESTNLIKALQEGLGGIRDVLIDGSQATYAKVFRNSDLALRRAQGNNIVIGGAPRYYMEALGITVIVFLAFILVQKPGGVSSAIPILGALALGAQRLLPVIQAGYSALTTMQGGHSSLKDILELLEQDMPEKNDIIKLPPLSFNNSIDIQKINFQYNQKLPYVLKNISLNIKKGSRVGFIGTTGSGKSTLLDIIMGLLEPSDGVISIDGEPLTNRNNRSWQSHIAHVPQAIFLSDTSIKENIAFGVEKNNIDFERVKLAAKQAQISDTIDSWSKKYNTVVGERGIKLSGGQRQRIGIARALYKNADVIIFDEATNALDSQTEANVMKSIESLNKNLTILIIAHRVSTLENCSQIIKLVDGNVEKIGSYNEVISSF